MRLRGIDFGVLVRVCYRQSGRERRTTVLSQNNGFIARHTLIVLRRALDDKEDIEFAEERETLTVGYA